MMKLAIKSVKLAVNTVRQLAARAVLAGLTVLLSVMRAV